MNTLRKSFSVLLVCSLAALALSAQAAPPGVASATPPITAAPVEKNFAPLDAAVFPVADSAVFAPVEVLAPLGSVNAAEDRGATLAPAALVTASAFESGADTPHSKAPQSRGSGGEADSRLGSHGVLAAILSAVLGFGALGNIRRVQDARLNKTINLPAAGSTTDSAAIEIGTGPHVENIEIQVVLPATPSLADTKNVNLTLQHSADGSTSWSAIAEEAVVNALGAGGAGGSAVTREVRLPSSFLGYLRLHAAVDGSGGNNTAVVAQLNVLM